MIIKFSLNRLFIILLLVILLPLIQNQWLNLYLFEINESYFYKYIYFFSGIICPFLVSINSINKFTYYSFNNTNKTKSVKGKALFLLTSIAIITLSTLISNYFYFNFEIIDSLFLNINFSNNDVNNKNIFILIVCLCLIFKKTRLLIKKSILLNYFLISIFIWYMEVNNIPIYFTLPNIFKSENFNFINIIYILTIEVVYYLWSYISYQSNLSDWEVSVPNKKEIFPIFFIVVFYLGILFYYSLVNHRIT